METYVSVTGCGINNYRHNLLGVLSELCGQGEMTSVAWFSGVFWHFSLEIRADLCYDKIDLHEVATNPR